MRNKGDISNSVASALIAVLLVLLFATVLGSWAAAVMGCEVDSLLSEEGIRWMFRWWASPILHQHTMIVLTTLMVVGACSDCGFSRALQHPWSLLTSLIAMMCMLLPLYLLTMRPNAPLQSITGHVLSSPFLLGIVFALGVIVVLSAMLFGLLSGHLRSWRVCADLLSIGLRRFAQWMVVWLLAEQLYYLIMFVFHI